MKTELETLRSELHKEVDAKIDKLIKPEFEVGDYVEWMGCHRTKGRIVKRYGDNYHLSLDFSNTPSESHDSCNYRNLRKLTPTEVQEALEKEAVKKYDGIKRIKSLCDSCKETDVANNFNVWFNSTTNKLWCKSKSGYNICLMDEKGTWATPIKTMTIDELASDFHSFRMLSDRKDKAATEDFIDFLLKNKTQIIETLNNL